MAGSNQQALAANSATSAGSKEYLSSSVSFDRLKTVQDKPFASLLKIENQQYFTPLEDQPELNRANMVSIRFLGTRALEENGRVLFGSNIVFSSQMTESTTVFGVNEFYFDLPFQNGTSQNLTFGRKLQDWSDLDRFWNLGMFESKLYTDTLRLESQGLTGAFFHQEGEVGKVLLFLTPISIPNQGPEIKEENGSIKVDNRWYQTPTNEFSFQNNQNKIDYEIDIKDRLALANHSAASAQLGLGTRQSGFWSTASYARKPINDLILARQNYLRTDSATVSATVRPEVAYHEIFGANAGYAAESWNVSIAYLADAPETKLPDQDWLVQKPLPFFAYGAHLGLDLNTWFQDGRVAIDYMKIYGGGIVDVDSKGVPDDITFLDQRFTFTHPIRFQLQSRLLTFGRKYLKGAASYLYEMDQKGSLVKVELAFHQSEKLIWNLGADALGVENGVSDSSTGFLNRFKANDRAYGGATYVF